MKAFRTPESCTHRGTRCAPCVPRSSAVPLPFSNRCTQQFTFIPLQKHANRELIVAAAFPGLVQLLGSSGKGRQRRAKYTAAAAELLQLLTTKQQHRQAAAASGRAAELVQVLLSCRDVPFQEQLLGGGPWLVLYTQGGPQLWKATYNAGKMINASNAASQDLDPSTNTVINRAEYFGSRLYVTASGTYQALGTNIFLGAKFIHAEWWSYSMYTVRMLLVQDPSPSLPKSIQANISSGLLHMFGLNVPLPIKGTGLFEVVWLDDNLRLFRSGSAVSVQVREGYLREAGLLPAV